MTRYKPPSSPSTSPSTAPSTAPSPPLHAWSACALAQAYASGEVSPVHATESALAHISRCEPSLHALFLQFPELALEQAAASSQRWAKGTPLSALDGVPITLKDNIATRGHPMPLGTAASDGQPAQDDSPPAARVREAGLVVLGKTTMPDYGMLSSGLSSLYPAARNPWDLSKTPGGSSAGAGAAAAAGYGPLHVGTDIGGSIRLPAGWCGVVGFKPSLGRIPIKPPYAGRVAGPMTRTVADAAALMQVLAQPDWRDTMSLPAQTLPWHELEKPGAEPGASLRGLRLALLWDAGWGLPLAPGIRHAVAQAVGWLQAAGAQVHEVPPFTSREMADGINGFWRMRSWLDLQALPPERRAKVLPYIRQWAAIGEHTSAAQVFHGYSQMGALREAAVGACQPFDFLISPVAPVSAFDALAASPTGDPLRAMEHIAYTLPFNMSEQPAISVPCGHDEQGLPVGLQIVGHRHDDMGVLRVAKAFEQIRPAGALCDWPQPN